MCDVVVVEVLYVFVFVGYFDCCVVCICVDDEVCVVYWCVWYFVV